MTSRGQYACDLDAAVRTGIVYVTPKQFEKVAKREGWDAETIRLMLLPPAVEKPFLIGKGAFRVGE